MNTKKLSVFCIMTLFLLSSWSVLLVNLASSTSPTDTGNGNPPGDGVLENEGDWYIAEGEEEWHNDTEIIVNGNIHIEGELHLDNVQLYMNLTENGTALVVNDTGLLVLNNVNLTSRENENQWQPGWYFRLNYTFMINGEARITNSSISKMWSQNSAPYQGGIQVYSDDVLIRDSEVHHNHWTGFHLRRNVTLFNVSVHNSSFGVVVYNASPTIENSSFTGILDTSFNLYNDSHPVVINCDLPGNPVTCRDENSTAEVSVYVDIGVFHSNMSAVAGASIYCVSQGGGVYRNFTTDEEGWARDKLLVEFLAVKVGSSTQEIPKERYDITVSKDDVTNFTTANIADTQVIQIVLFGEGFGYAASSGDINNDGLMDFAVSAPYNSVKKEKAGAVYLYYGSHSQRLQEFEKDEADAVIYSNTRNGLFGYNVDMETDYNQDGVTDLIVSAPGFSSDKGKVFIYYGGETFNTASPDFSLEWGESNFFGTGVGSGDVDNDALTDMVINSEDASYVFYGSGAIPKTADIWDMDEDKGTPEVDFTHGVNFTANTFGIDGDNDGWDWAEGNAVYGRTQDMTHIFAGKGGTKVAAEGKTHDNSPRLEIEVGGRTDRSMDSGAWGVEFYITSDMINDTQKDRKLYFQFKWEAYDRERFYGDGDGGTEEYVYIKTRITNSSGSYFLGDDEEGHSSEPKPNVWSHSSWRQNNPWSDSGTFSTDLSGYLDGEGWYYLDFGAKLDATHNSGQSRLGEHEGIRAYFDDVLLYLSSAPFELGLAEEGMHINGNYDADDFDDMVINTGSSILLYYGSSKGFSFVPELELQTSQDFTTGTFDGTAVGEDKVQLAKKYTIPNGDFDDGWNHWTQKRNKLDKNNARWEITTEAHGDWMVHNGPTAGFGINKEEVGGQQSDCDGRLDSDTFTVTTEMESIRLWHHAEWASFESADDQQGVSDELELHLRYASDDTIIDGVAYGPDHGTGGNGEREGYLTWDTSGIVGEEVYIRAEISGNGGQRDCALLQLDQVEIIGSPYEEYGNFTSEVERIDAIEGFLVECEKDESVGEVTVKVRADTGQPWDNATEIDHLNSFRIDPLATDLQVRVSFHTDDEEQTPTLEKLVLYGYADEKVLPTHIDLGLAPSAYKGLSFNTHPGDWNNDGFDDIAIAASSGDKVYIFPGGDDISGKTLTTDNASVVITGPADSGFGRSLDFVGDVNADDHDELLVGAPFSDGTRGSLYLFTDIGDGAYDTTDASYSFFGTETAERFGSIINEHVVSSSKARINAGKAELINLYDYDSGIYNLVYEEAPSPDSSTSFSGAVINVGQENVPGRALQINVTAYRNDTGSNNGLPYYFDDSAAVPALDKGDTHAFEFQWDVPDFEDLIYNVTFTFDAADNNEDNDEVALQVHSRFYKVELSTDQASLSSIGGKAINYTVILTNLGNLGNDTVSLDFEIPAGWNAHFHDGGMVIEDIEITDSKTINFSVMAAYEEAVGHFPLKVVVTSENNWRQAELLLDFEVIRPNLKVADIIFMREDRRVADAAHHLVVDEPAQIKAEIVNDGDVDTLFGFYVGLYQDDTLLERQWTDILPMGDSRYLSFDWQAALGNHNIKVVADDHGQPVIPEKNEGDNATIVGIDVKDRVPVGEYTIQGFVKNIYLEPVTDGEVVFSSDEWPMNDMENNTIVATDQDGYYTITLDSDDYLDNQHITIMAQDANYNETKKHILYSEDMEIWMNLTLRQYDVLLDYGGNYSKSGDPGSTVNYLIDITNTGNINDTLSLMLEGLPDGWDFSITGENVKKEGASYLLTIATDETITIRVAITISSNMKEAEANLLYEIMVKAESMNANGVSDSLPVYTVVSSYRQLEIEFVTPPGTVIPFEELELEFTVENKGNSQRNVVLELSGTHKGLGSLSQSHFSLPIDTQIPLTLSVNLTESLDTGSLVSIGIGEPGEPALAYANMTVGEYRDFEVTDSGIPVRENGSARFTGDGHPGQETLFETEIVNTGNVDVELELEDEGGSTGDVEIGYSISNNDLAQGATEVLSVSFLVKQEAEKETKFELVINVTAVDKVSRIAYRFASLSYEVVVGEYYNFTLAGDGFVQDYAGREDSKASIYIYELTLANNGNMPDTPRFLVDVDTGWDFTLEAKDPGKEGVPLQPGETRFYSLVLVIPLDVSAASAGLNVTVLSTTDPGVVDKLSIQAAVAEEDHALEVMPKSITSDTVSQEDEERPRYVYEVEITNTGNVSEQVFVSPQHPRLVEWYPVIDEKDFVMRPGETRTISFRLLRPADVNKWNGELSLSVTTGSGLELIQILNKPPFAELVLNTGIISIHDLTVKDLLLFSLRSAKDEEDKETMNITWDMDDGTFFYTEDFNYKYKRYGDYDIVCTLKDKEGGITYLKISLTINNIDPVAKITISSQENATLPLYENITLSASDSYDPDGDIAEYKWTLNERLLGEGKYLTTYFEKKGLYSIDLEVTDTGGLVHDESIEITVVDEVVTEKPPTTTDEDKGAFEEFMDENDQVIEYISLGLLGLGVVAVLIMAVTINSKKQATKKSEKEIKELQKFLDETKK